MSKKIDVSFITINYNSTTHTIELLESILKHTSTDYEVIVVDNASTCNELNMLEQFCNKYEQVTIVKNRVNSGFASGNMLGINYANAEYYFFINNDTKLLNDCASIMKEYLDANKSVSLATAKVNDENGNFSSSYKLFPTLTKELFGNTIARKFSKNSFPSNKERLEVPTLVEVVSGSCMFFRASTFCKIGGFDTAFFLYCEEEDISKRVWNSGCEVAFLPDAQIYHKSGGSTQKSYDIEKEYYISYKHLIKKHYGVFASFTVLFLQKFKLFRRACKRKNGFKLFWFGVRGFSTCSSLRYEQGIKIDY